MLRRIECAKLKAMSVHDHRHEQAIERLPNDRVDAECGKRGEYSRPMFRDVAAVQLEALLADPDGGMRIHGFEGALCAVRVLA
jgi:hypothetical protein